CSHVRAIRTSSSSTCRGLHPTLHSFPTRRSSDLDIPEDVMPTKRTWRDRQQVAFPSAYCLSELTGKIMYPQLRYDGYGDGVGERSEEHTSELQSHLNLVCRLLLEKKKKERITATI